MKNKKGFISTSIIYSFFLVFILLMIAFLMSFANKRFLNDKIGDKYDPPGGEIKLACFKGENLNDCLIKAEYIEYKNIIKKDERTYLEEKFLDYNIGFNNIKNYTKNAVLNAINKKISPDFTEPALNEEGLYAIGDYYTINNIDKENEYSYYYRGAEDDNYLVFDDFVWRIIRINGNGTIRLIYQGFYNNENDNNKVSGAEYINEITFNLNGINETLLSGYEATRDYYCAGYDCIIPNGRTCKKTQEYYATKCNEVIAEIEKLKKSAGSHVPYKTGYMNSSFFSQNGYNAKYSNSENSTIKEEVDNWYINNINGTNSANFLADSIFCGDKNRLCKYNWSRCGDITSATASVDQFYYEAYDRIVETNMPTLDCLDSGSLYENTDNYKNGYINRNLSRYTSIANGISKNGNGVVCSGADCKVADDGAIFNLGAQVGFVGTNGDLQYPIALLSADEMIMSGAVYNSGEENKVSNSFLKGLKPFWSMTLAYTDNVGTIINNGDSEAKKGTRYFMMNETGKVQFRNDAYYTATVRPVINLKKEIKYCSGTGTISDPYIIGDGSC